MPEIISRKEAKARGLKRYFTGEPCKQGHIVEKHVVNAKCIECGQAESRLRWEKKCPNMVHLGTTITCKICAKPFVKTQRAQVVCSKDCARVNQRLLARAWEGRQPEEKLLIRRKKEAERARQWRLDASPEQKMKRQQRERDRSRRERAAYLAIKELGMEV